ncbi:hypothetical protein CI109_100862 [Kwoniella shandongensis]|uniref:EKC/KEOPS complex subunit CGI121 n=1 Tax=Kwoniella shandongensis TaxID=1734106 RepID=A0A5M6BTL3_9TREE|nr:uncharacterized protein CI109_006114 [Kwoniella shandongensis]KAA5525541.1 hypothetical protein CI109_006114 [Kwoniella shandongensis]
METYTLSNFPSAYSTIHIALFSNVTNAPEIRTRLIAASVKEGEEGDRARAEVDFGFVEAGLLVSKEHLLTAILTTLLYAFPSSPPSAPEPLTTTLSSLSILQETVPSSSTTLTPTPNTSTPSTPSPSAPTSGKPKTRSHNLHSEILLSLSPNNNITDSIRRHGISDTTTTLAVVRFGSPDVGAEEVWKGMNGVVEGELVSWDEGRVENATDWTRVDKVYKLNELNALKSPDVKEKKVRAVISSVAIKNVI